jgi:tryptophan synthase alpha chain
VKKLMTHVVVGAPNLQITKRMVREMTNRNIAAVELQIPFSDPIADGPVLMSANDQAVKNGISIDTVLGLVSTGPTKSYLMSYLQPILHYGPSAFFRQALEAGCAGFIIPDLPYDAPETKTFIDEVPELRHTLIPVLSPRMAQFRLDRLFKILKPELIYLTARHGITGERTDFSKDLSETIKRIRALTDAKIAVGFGIQTPADVRAVLHQADLAVVGSALTKALSVSEEDARNLLDKLCKEA